MKIDPHAYNITIRRAEVEGDLCFEARVKELPDLTEYADTTEEAYALAVDAIETTASVLTEKRRAMPTPYVPADDFSGRVTLRLPKSLHRALTEAAEKERVSLNLFIATAIAEKVGAGHPSPREERQAELVQLVPVFIIPKFSIKPGFSTKLKKKAIPAEDKIMPNLQLRTVLRNVC